MKAQSQIAIAENYGIINHEEGVMRAAALSKELTSMLEGRQIGETPKGEASTLDLIDAWYRGWGKARSEARKRELSQMED